MEDFNVISYLDCKTNISLTYLKLWNQNKLNWAEPNHKEQYVAWGCSDHSN